jgi:hypothetical protein
MYCSKINNLKRIQLINNIVKTFQINLENFLSLNEVEQNILLHVYSLPFFSKQIYGAECEIKKVIDFHKFKNYDDKLFLIENILDCKYECLYRIKDVCSLICTSFEEFIEGQIFLTSDEKHDLYEEIRINISKHILCNYSVKVKNPISLYKKVNAFDDTNKMIDDNFDFLISLLKNTIRKTKSLPEHKKIETLLLFQKVNFHIFLDIFKDQKLIEQNISKIKEMFDTNEFILDDIKHSYQLNELHSQFALYHKISGLINKNANYIAHMHSLWQNEIKKKEAKNAIVDKTQKFISDLSHNKTKMENFSKAEINDMIASYIPDIDKYHDYKEKINDCRMTKFQKNNFQQHIINIEHNASMHFEKDVENAKLIYKKRISLKSKKICLFETKKNEKDIMVFEAKIKRTKQIALSNIKNAVARYEKFCNSYKLRKLTYDIDENNEKLQALTTNLTTHL